MDVNRWLYFTEVWSMWTLRKPRFSIGARQARGGAGVTMAVVLAVYSAGVTCSAQARDASTEQEPTPVSCLCVEDRLDVIDERLSCEGAAAGLHAAGLIRPSEAGDATTGLAGCDGTARAGCTGELWLCFGVGTAEH